MKTKIPHLILASLFGATIASQAASVILIDDDFSSSTAVVGSRFYKADINSGKWVGSAGWSVTGEQLTSAATAGSSTHLINSVSSTAIWADRVTLSFDYSVGAGSTLYFYSTLFTGEADNSLAARMKTDGNYWANDFNTVWGTNKFGFLGPEYNLSGGGLSGNTVDAVTSFGGITSGTFSQTYDISGFGGGDFSIEDVSNVLAVFTVDAAAAGVGAISIDNFNMTAVPEPSSTALLGLGGLALMLRRKRS